MEVRWVIVHVADVDPDGDRICGDILSDYLKGRESYTLRNCRHYKVIMDELYDLKVGK